MSEPRLTADGQFLTYLSIILLFGLVMLSSASIAIGQQRFGDGYFFIKKQLLLGLIPGMIAFYFFAKLSYERLRRWSSVIYAATVAVLVLVFIPGVGSNLNTAATSWLVIGGFSVQPAEFAKLGTIIFFAAYLSRRSEELSHFQSGFIPAVVVAGLPIGLVLLQPDVGTVSILFAIVFAMLFAAKTKTSHVALLAGLGIVGLIALIAVAPYRAARLTVFLHPELDPQGIGYQTTQALVAVGSGGLFGLGLGHSRQKFQYLPEVHADSIFAVIAEEMGFFVVAGFVVVAMLMYARMVTMAKVSGDEFAKLLIVGVLAWLMFQTFLNVGATVGVLPLTGVPLPFVSHGGTALMVTLAAMGIVTNISKHVRNNV